MLFEDVAYSLIGDMVSNIGQRALDPIVAPSWIFLDKSQNQVDDGLADSRSTDTLLLIAVIPFFGHQHPMPAEDRIWSHDGGQFH